MVQGLSSDQTVRVCRHGAVPSGGLHPTARSALLNCDGRVIWSGARGPAGRVWEYGFAQLLANADNAANRRSFRRIG
jgi:hypothetical protein